jgi:carbon storage regulator
MLVLTRKLNESVRIDGDITVTVVKIDGKQIRLGIDAPRDVAVRREELLPLYAPADESLAVFAQPLVADAVAF